MDSMSKQAKAIPEELLSKDFLNQFKAEDEVSHFLKNLQQLLERMLQGEIDAHLGYKKYSPKGNNTGNSRNGSFSKKYLP